MNSDRRPQEMSKRHMVAVLLSVVTAHGPIYGFQISIDPALHRLALKGWMTATSGPSPRGVRP